MSKALVLLRAWNGRDAGTVLASVPDGQANLMIQNGFAELEKPAKKKRKPRKPNAISDSPKS